MKVFKITREGLDLYNQFKKVLRCFNGMCLQHVICVEERKASRGAKRLVYRIMVKKPCEDVSRVLERIASIGLYKQLARRYEHTGHSVAYEHYNSRAELEIELLEMHVRKLKADRRKKQKEMMQSLGTT
jgi:hypothetical protein